MKQKKPTFDVWVKRDHIFTAKIQADSLEQALEKAHAMSIDQLLEAPGETIESEHKFTSVTES